MIQKVIVFLGLIASVLIGLTSSVKAVDEKNIYETIETSSKHHILLAAIKELAIADSLKAKGANTLLAPTDEAFKRLSDTELQKFIASKELFRKTILSHWVQGKTLKTDDLKEKSGKDINGFLITVSDGLKIGNAKVTTANLSCTNGIVHVIDAVLIPKE